MKIKDPNLVLTVRGVPESGHREMAVINYNGEVLFERPVANGGLRYIQDWLSARGYKCLPGFGVWVASGDEHGSVASVSAVRAEESTVTIQHNLFEMEKAA